MMRYSLTILNNNGNKAMFDFRSYSQIVQDVAIATAKAIHKPSLSNKESMAEYAKAIGASGVKASFTTEQKADMIEWSV